jgi:hypothetical protein
VATSNPQRQEDSVFNVDKAIERIKTTTKGVKINTEAWKRMLENSPEGNVEDRRTPEGERISIILSKIRNKEKLTKEEVSFINKQIETTDQLAL